MKTFPLTVASPDGNKFCGECVKLDLRTTEGELAVMAGHIPFAASVVGGECAVWLSENEVKKATCDGGLLTVAADRVTLISGSFQFK